MKSRIVSFAKVVLALTAIAACTSEPAPHSAPDASTEDAVVPGDSSTDPGDSSTDPGDSSTDADTPPELLDCRALIECRSACGFEDAESCLEDCDDAASEDERALADALRACISSSFETCRAGFLPDGSCVLETCAAAAGDCVGVDDEPPNDALTCGELMQCLAGCENDTECFADCHASASSTANDLFDRYLECLDDPEHAAQCETEDGHDYVCLNGLCSDANLACNQHAHEGDDDGESCEEVVNCFDDCVNPVSTNYACQLICFADGSANAQAEVLESGKELFSCHNAAIESCMISEDELDDACYEAAAAECPAWYTCP
jgi:hypothetical protein